MNLSSLQHLVRAVRSLAEDLAATKLLVGRAKDIALVRHLGITGRLSRHLVVQRLDSIPKTERLLLTSSQALAQALGR